MLTPRGHHYYQEYRKCERAFYWRQSRGYVLKLRDPKLSLGSLVHAAIRLVHIGDPPERAIANSVEQAGFGVEQQVVDDARVLTVGYAAWKPKYPIQIVTAEQELTAELAPGIPYTGRPDALAEDPAKRLWIPDWKTTTESFGRFFQRFRMSWQMVGYTWLALENGLPAAGYIMRCIRKLKTPQFDDRKYLVGKSLLRNFQKQHLAWHVEIEAKREQPKDLWRQDTDQCVTIYGKCPFLKLCLNPRTEEQALAAYYDRVL